MYSPPQSEIKIGTAERVSIRNGINIAILDPPYLDSVKSYASLSLIHYGALAIYDHFAGIPAKWNILKKDLGHIEKLEISRDKEGYQRALITILKRIRENLEYEGRIVILFNRVDENEWLNVIDAIHRADLQLISAYWSLGESPGKLARSKLRGVYSLILRKKLNESMYHPIRIVFNNVINMLKEYEVNIAEEVEERATESLVKAISFVFGDAYNMF